MSAQWVEHAPGKVNLCLFVGLPRPTDGYHPLVSVFQTTRLQDTLTAVEAAADEVVCPGIPGENLVTRAVRAFRAHHGLTDGPFLRITIDKRVPVAAGMGGGSADAAAALRLMARITGCELPPLDVQAALGADVPAAVLGGRALVTGIGEHVDPLPPGEAMDLVVLPLPDHGLSTPQVYAEADRGGDTRADLDAKLHEVKKALASGDPPPLGNDLQAAATRLCPPIAQALDALRGAGAHTAFVTGSGPTCVALADDPHEVARRTGGVVA